MTLTETLLPALYITTILPCKKDGNSSQSPFVQLRTQLIV